jgi:hypothetical protein
MQHSDSDDSDMSDIEEETLRTSDEQHITKGKSTVADHIEQRPHSPRTTTV